jgi:hypothetical protein
MRSVYLATTLFIIHINFALNYMESCFRSHAKTICEAIKDTDVFLYNDRSGFHFTVIELAVVYNQRIRMQNT